MAGTPTDEDDVQIGRNLALHRRAAGFTQRSAGALIGVSATQVQKYESGTNHISAGNLHTLSQHFAVPLASFFQGLRAPAASGGFAERRQTAYATESPWAEVVFALVRAGETLDATARTQLRDALKQAAKRLK